MNESSLDLHTLELFRLVATETSFTRAATQAGLTQSAVTRQIQGLEENLDIQLFERTTRNVRLTRAGEFLMARSTKLLATVEDTLRDLREEFHLAPKTVTVGVSKAIGLAYLPGFFHAFQRHHPEILTTVSSASGETITQKIIDGDLDIGFLSPPRRLPREIEITHQFDDTFTFIAPPDYQLPDNYNATLPSLRRLIANERTLLITSGTTGSHLRHWLEEKQIDLQPAMELDSFDLIINLVAQGMGISLVPRRALPIYNRSRPVQRIPSKHQPTRQLAVIARKNRQRPEEIENFLNSILFGSTT